MKLLKIKDTVGVTVEHHCFNLKHWYYTVGKINILALYYYYYFNSPNIGLLIMKYWQTAVPDITEKNPL